MKTCSVTGCNNPVWSKGLCQKHAPRAPLKKTSKGFKRAGIKIYKEEADALKRYTFFNQIWYERPHICQHCGVHLGREPRSYMFDHLLEKSTHPELEYEKDNILLVCLECHDEKTRGFISEKYQEKINFVKTKFNVS